MEDTWLVEIALSTTSSEWGLKHPSLLFLTVAKQVDIDIATTGHVTWPAGASRDDSNRQQYVAAEKTVTKEPHSPCAR